MALAQSLPNTQLLKQIAAFIAPFLLIASMLAVFKGLNTRFGYPLGYFLAFIIYWLGWCLLFPAILLGGFGKLIDLFRPVQSFAALDWQSHALLWWPTFFPLLAIFIPRIARASLPILIGSVILGLLIGITEEILWRGVYLQLFPSNLWLGILYPSLMFGLWHICPQSVLENRMPGGVFSFVAYAALLGLSYAFAAQRTGSIFWPAVPHILHDTLGLGGFAYTAWLGKR
jgi:membrane protease YdiL (CAAX protease family)